MWPTLAESAIAPDRQVRLVLAHLLRSGAAALAEQWGEWPLPEPAVMVLVRLLAQLVEADTACWRAALN